MKMLLTGERGKLVTRFCKYIQENRDDIDVQLMSVRGDEWRDADFAMYDVVVHCAGLINCEEDSYEEYERVNVRLTRDIFTKCVEQKVPYFIYLSSMAVYDGTEWGFGEQGIITAQTKPFPKSYYGKSKYVAEQAIESVPNNGTTVAIVRAPSIVGGAMEDYFGKYIRFSRLPFLPIPKIHLEAKRSFVYVETLIEFICYLAENVKAGIFFPQNYPSLSVSEMYEEVCKAQGKKRLAVRLASGILPSKIEKQLFRQICYEEELSKEENEAVGRISAREAIHLVVEELVKR